jgi:8-oxo-dGTP pyrophosphatase MutT (NUDIX family)
MSPLPRPLIRDPHAVPVVGTDAHLPAVDAARLSADALRARFAAPPAWAPEFAGDGARFCDRAPAAASVLVPLVAHDGGLTVMLTQRTAHLRDHAGQISFPGGRVEAHDADAIATALRETEEEIGLARAHVDVIGQLPAYNTVTNFVVTPVVALVRPGFTLALDSFEVAEAFEVPLPFLMNPAHHQRHRFDAAGATRHFLSMPWDAALADGTPRRYFIWGATAAMLRNLYRMLAA